MPATRASVVAATDERAQVSQVDHDGGTGQCVAEMPGDERGGRAQMGGPHQIQIRAGQPPPLLELSGNPDQSGPFRFPDTRFAIHTREPAPHQPPRGTDTHRLSPTGFNDAFNDAPVTVRGFNDATNRVVDHHP